MKLSVRFKDASTEPEHANLQLSGLKRSKRLNNDLPHYEDGDVVHTLLANFSMPSSDIRDHESLSPKKFLKRIFYVQERLNTLIDISINHVSEFVLAAIDNEACSFKEMLKHDDRADFVSAMEKEVDVHERRNHWEMCNRKDIPKGMKTIMSIWAFKRKRLPSGELLKHKARLCAHGGQQQ